MPGNSPGWENGYTPSASEWNAWWATKLDTDGGALDGNLSVGTLNATAVSGTTISAASSMFTPVLGLSNGWVLLSDASANDLYQHSPGNYDIWTRSNGVRVWVANGKYVMNLDAIGNLTIPGFVSAASFNLANGFALASDPSNNDIYEHAPGSYDVWIRSNGQRSWVTNNVDTMNLDAAGNLTLTGSVVTKTLYLANGFNLTNDPNNNDLCEHSSGNYDIWLRSSGVRTWVASGVNAMTLDASGNLTVPLGLFAATLNLSSGWQLFSNPSGDLVSQFFAGTYDIFQAYNHDRAWYTNNVSIMDLSAAGNLNVLGAVTSASLRTAAGLIIYTNPGGDHIYQHATSSADIWQTANSARTWTAADVPIMILDAAGNLTCTGAVHGSNISSMSDMLDNFQARITALEARP